MVFAGGGPGESHVFSGYICDLPLVLLFIFSPGFFAARSGGVFRGRDPPGASGLEAEKIKEKIKE
jgi:hypothetical protein